LRLLLDLKAERGLTLMMVTHQPEDLRQAADTFAFIEDGEVRHVLPSAKFFSRSAPPEIRAYLGKG
jgi:thiamine transport system ATP-binding protein